MAVERQIDNTEIDDLPVDNDGSETSATLQKEGKPDLKGRGIFLFIRQIINEIKKVTAPTKDELIEYTIVVLVFVLVIMLFITGVDVAIGQLIMTLFAR